ncbi:nuclear transport factor 2 family protein [Pseudokineococcus sp. 1T1Z-3]|uniref:nuclear transport factor 2 family protein n=1 Tax=Pseudokineococcus sp. 1T1Z-3 TaxID=3132745 RepID=UPI0030AABBA0
MADSHFAPAVTALTAALGPRLRPGGPGFADLFTPDALLETPFDGDGDGPGVEGREAVAAMVTSLAGVLTFYDVRVHRVLDVDATTVVCEYEALLQRHDLGCRLRRRYVGVMTISDGLVAHLREYGGPFMPSTAERLG